MDSLSESNKFLFYSTDEGKQNIQVYLDGDSETVWMTQSGIADSLGTTKQNVSKHLINIFKEGELIEESVVKKMLTTASDGKKYKTSFYNLDAIISIGYRVNSQKATRFRIWATSIIKEYLVKGFAMDDDRLKQGKTLFGKDYFDELLVRIREIRVSERRFYQKVTDLYATSVDYNPKSKITNTFYATVQNKLEYAITKMTAAEIIKSRANSNEKDMGLTNWKDQKKGGKIQKTDVSVAKNYLTEKELSDLNFLVSMYLDYAESQARKQNLMSMMDWVDKLDAFLQFNEYEILVGAGKIQAKVAKKFAETEFIKFRTIQDQSYVSDYDDFSVVSSTIQGEGKLPTENYKKFKSSFSIEEELEKARKKLGIETPKNETSSFDNSLKTALNFNPKKKD